MKTIFKFIAYTILYFFAFIVLYAIIAFIGVNMTVNKHVKPESEVAVYIQTNGTHTDLVVPVKTDHFDWSKEIKFENTIGKDSAMNFLSIGWGDRGFFLEVPNWSDLKYSIVFKAMFGLGRTAMHTTFYKTIKEKSDCKKIMLSKQQYTDLVYFISKKFNKDANGHVVLIPTKANYSKTDAFYEGRGRYNIFYTCNTWANDGLKACGQKACLWTPVDFGIFRIYK